MMGVQRSKGRWLIATWLVSSAVLGWGGPCDVRGAVPEVRSGQGEGGYIIGQVDLPEALPGDSVVEVLVMAPEWASQWNSDVQERLRVYFSNSAQAIERDRSLFDRIAYRARREATAYVAARMQGNLGVEVYQRWVREVASDGTFEFGDLEFGEYQVIVVAQGETASYLWAQPVRVSGNLPQFVDMGPYFR